MFNKRILIAAPFVLVAAATAGAQTGQTPYTLAVGWNYLVDKDARDATKASGYSATLGYKIPGLFKANPGVDSAVELSFARNEGNGNRIDLGSLSFVVRAPFSAGEKGGSFVPYGGLGIGIGRGTVTGDNISITSNGSGGTIQSVTHVSETKTVATGKVLVGAKFSSNMFVEAAYNLTGSISGVKPSSLNVSVGIRF